MVKQPGVKAQSPCLDCQKRTVSCHAVCEAYRQYRIGRAAFLSQRRRETERDAAMIEHVRRTAARKR